MFAKALTISSILCALNLVWGGALPGTALALDTGADATRRTTGKPSYRTHQALTLLRAPRNAASRLLKKFGLGKILKPTVLPTLPLSREAYKEYRRVKAMNKGREHDSVREGTTSRRKMDRIFQENRLVEKDVLRDYTAQVAEADTYQNRILKQYANEEGVYPDMAGKHHLKVQHKAKYAAASATTGTVGGFLTAAGIGVAQAGGWGAFSASGVSGGLFLAAGSTLLSIATGGVVGLVALGILYKVLKKGRINAHKDASTARAESEGVQNKLKQAEAKKRTAEEVLRALEGRDGVDETGGDPGDRTDRDRERDHERALLENAIHDHERANGRLEQNAQRLRSERDGLRGEIGEVARERDELHRGRDEALLNHREARDARDSAHHELQEVKRSLEEAGQRERAAHETIASRERYAEELLQELDATTVGRETAQAELDAANAELGDLVEAERRLAQLLDETKLEAIDDRRRATQENANLKKQGLEVLSHWKKTAEKLTDTETALTQTTDNLKQANEATRQIEEALKQSETTLTQTTDRLDRTTREQQRIATALSESEANLSDAESQLKTTRQALDAAPNSTLAKGGQKISNFLSSMANWRNREAQPTDSPDQT